MVRDWGTDTSKGIKGVIREEEAKLRCSGSRVNRKQCFWEEGVTDSNTAETSQKRTEVGHPFSKAGSAGALDARGGWSRKVAESGREQEERQ